VYSTYLGGSGTDSPRVAVDSTGKATVVGSTTSSNFPTYLPFQASIGGSTDAFVTRLTAGTGPWRTPPTWAGRPGTARWPWPSTR